MDKNYDLDMLKEVYRYAKTFSTDPSTQNAAFILTTDDIILKGANHFPTNVIESPDRWQRPLKYSYVEHAERNALYQGSKRGISTDKGIMYCPWAACTDCMRGIIQSGVSKLVVHHNPLDNTRFGSPVSDLWKESIKIALTMLEESGVELVFYNDKLFDDDFKFRFNGSEVSP
jgi:dCMP deaminase